MQLLLVIAVALLLVLVVKMEIRDIERELRRKPIRYDRTDWAIRDES
jgi:hypothetical protein